MRIMFLLVNCLLYMKWFEHTLHRNLVLKQLVHLLSVLSTLSKGSYGDAYKRVHHREFAGSLLFVG
jgi:hypothetical protein